VAAIESISGSQEDGKIQNVEGDPECGKPKKKKRKSKEEESKRCNNLEDEGIITWYLLEIRYKTQKLILMCLSQIFIRLSQN